MDGYSLGGMPGVGGLIPWRRQSIVAVVGALGGFGTAADGTVDLGRLLGGRHNRSSRGLARRLPVWLVLGESEQEMTKDITRRLATVIGHLQGIRKMSEEGRYCIDVIKQIEAVEAALAKTKEVVLAGHLDSCVKEAMRGKDERTMKRVMKELLQVFKMEK